MRSETEKQERREKDKKEAEEYKIFFRMNQSLRQTCRKCHEEKELKQFVGNYSFRTTCKECHRNKIKSGRRENRDKTRESVIRSGKKSSAFIAGLKIGKPCNACGENFPPHALDFHHIRDKEWTISKLYGKSQERIFREIEKCTLLCANCHRDETQISSNTHPIYTKLLLFEYREVLPESPTRRCKKCKLLHHELDFSLMYNGYRHSYCIPCKREYERSMKRNRSESPTKKFLNELKDNKPCKDCGETFRYWQMDFDHISEDKVKNINKMQFGSLEAAMNEVKKCDLVCSVCHRIRTYSWRRNTRRCQCGYAPKSPSDSAIHMKSCPQVETMQVMSKEDAQKLVQSTTLNSAKIEDVREFLNTYHYAGYGRSASCLYIAQSLGYIMAVVKFSPPVRKEVATSLGWRHDQVLELDRFCIRPKWQVKNLGSKIISLAVEQIRIDFPDVLILISFADSDQMHTGTLYKASNWTHVGQTSTSYIYVDKSGIEHNKKTVYEIAKRKGMKEREWAEISGLMKRKTGVKEKFIYELR